MVEKNWQNAVHHESSHESVYKNNVETLTHNLNWKVIPNVYEI